MITRKELALMWLGSFCAVGVLVGLIAVGNALIGPAGEWIAGGLFLAVVSGASIYLVGPERQRPSERSTVRDRAKW